MCLPQENNPEFRAFEKHLCLLRELQYSVEWYGECKVGISVEYLFCQIDQRKISLLSILTILTIPRSCEDGFPSSASAWQFKAAAQIDKSLCTEKIPKTVQTL